jgi:hypothetical protein
MLARLIDECFGLKSQRAGLNRRVLAVAEQCFAASAGLIISRSFTRFRVSFSSLQMIA